ncbi:hypothetical protein D3C86_1173830 [compost metagenome]
MPASGVGPDVGSARLARAGVQQGHWGLVGVQYRAAEDEAPVRLVQRLQRRTGLAGDGRQRRARCVHAAAGVDGRLPVVRHVVHEAADQRVRDEAAGSDTALDDFCHAGRLAQHLAAAAGPLAIDVAVHEELGRHDVQALADLLADARHRAPAAGLQAVGALGLVVVFDTAQVIGERVAARPTWGRLGRCVRGCCGGRGRGGFTPKPLELLAQARLVLGQRLLEQAALLGVHGLGLGAELPALEPGQLEGDLLDLGLAQCDLVVLALQQRVALGERLVALRKDTAMLGQLLLLVLHPLEQLTNQRSCLGGQPRRIRSRKITRTKHALNDASARQGQPRHIHCQRMGRWRGRRLLRLA